MKRFKRIVVVACALLAIAAYAIPALPAAAQSSASLSIAPKKNYVIDPGKSVSDTLTIRNLDANDSLELSLRVVDFTYTDESGTPKLFLDPNAPQTTWSLKPFLSVPKSVTIGPDSSKTLDMKVAIPAGHGAGSYYSAIVYSSGAGSGPGTNVGLSASGVTLVFTTIPGEVKEDLKFQKLGAYREAAPNRPGGYVFFTADQPAVIGYTLQNSGNVTEAPAGSITLTDLFGHERKLEKINPTGSLALIGQTRTFTPCIKLKSQDVDFNGSKTEASTCANPGLWPGYYKISADLFYGQNGNLTQEITKTGGFWYLPWWFIIVAVIVLAILAYFIRRAYLRIRQMMGGSVKLKKPSRRR